MTSMKAGGSIISVKGLRKSYKNIGVLKGIDLDIKTGSIFCLLGSNGAGKTTTVKILSTLLRPDSGEITVCGYDIRKEPDKVRRSISVTGQYAAVDELLTGRENMHMIGNLFHAKRVKERTDALLTKFDLTNAANRQVGTYSGGMRRKLDIAMSLLGNPKVLFLDEPTTGLDPQNRLAMWDEIKNLKKNGTTIFLTTQYLEEAEKLADAVAILNEGNVVATGSVIELKSLLPKGAVEFEFSKTAFMKATRFLENRQTRKNTEANTITVMTDGSVDALTKLLVELKKADIPIRSVKLKEPTLEEVFLTQIGERTEV